MKKNLLKLFLSFFGLTITMASFACPITVSVTETNASCYASCNGELEATVSGTISSTLVYVWKDNNNTIVGNAATLSNLCAGQYTVTVYDTTTTMTQTDLLLSTFETGTTIPFTLNTTTMGGITPGAADNLWVINNTYLGGGTFGVPNTIQQNASISGSATSSYLHVANNVFIGQGAANAAYIDGSITQIGGQNGMNFTEMNVDVNTSGLTNVGLDLYYLCAGSLPKVYYSTDQGTNWTILPVLPNVTAWTETTLTNAAFDNQTKLRFAFSFHNTEGTIADPPFSLDEIKIYGEQITTSICEQTELATISEPETLTITSSAFTNTCNGDDGTVTAVASGGTGVITYAVGNGVATNTTGLFTGLGNGSYSVSVTDENGCTYTENNFDIITDCGNVAVNEEFDFEMNVFPNPFSNKVILSLSETKSVAVEIIDLMGQIIYSVSFKGQYQKINLNTLAKGVYFVEVEIDNKKQQFKIVKKYIN